MAGGKIDILVEPDASGFGGKLERSLAPALGIAGKVGAAMGLALGGTEVFRDVVSTGMEFQSQLNIMSAVSQATGEQLEAVSARARDLGKDSDLTATSASDAAAAMTELAKGGLTVEQSMAAAKGTLQLAAAAQVDAATAATIQSQALQAFSLSADDAGRVADILAGAANASSAEMTDVSQALQQAGTVASQFGVSIEDTATGIAMFANAGITGSDAGTLLKSALLALTDQGKPAQAAIKELGLQVYDSQGKFVGLESLMGQLKDASASMSDEQYQAATAVLFGSDAMRLAGVAAQQGAEGFHTLRDAVTRQGQAAEVAAAQTEGLPGAAERFSNAWEDALLGIYDALDTQLVAAANAGVDALERLAPAAAAAAGVTADSFGAASKVVSGAVSAYQALPGPIQFIAETMLLAKAATAGLHTETGGKLVAGLKTVRDGARTAGANVMIFGTSAKEAYGYARKANPELSRMGAAMQVVAGKGGMASAGMRGIKSAAGGLVSALGGPWGLAIGAAGMALGALVDSQMEAKRAAQEHAAEQKALKDTLDQTTGAITAQSRELIKQRLEESGAASGARKAGIDQATLIGAVDGRAEDRRTVQAAARSSVETDVNNSLAFKLRTGDALNTLDAKDYADALMGIPDAIEKIKAVDAEGNLEKVRKAVEAGGNEVSALGMEMGRLNQQMDQSKADVAADKFNQTKEAAERTRQVFGELGEMIFTMPDEKTIIVGADQHMTDATIEDLNAIGEGIEAVRNIDGSVRISLPEGQSVIETLNAIGGELSLIQHNGKPVIEIGNNSPEVQALLKALKIEVETLPDGSIAIASNTPEQIDRLVELGVLVKDEKTGKVTINSNLDDVLAKASALDARDGKNTSETHTITQVTNMVTNVMRNVGIAGASSLGQNANGSYRVMAAGALSDQEAQIAPGGSWLLWAEDSTEGESFIPHARSKRARSTQILAQTATLFGMSLVDAQGRQVRRDGTPIGPERAKAFADGAVRIKSAEAIKAGVAYMDGTGYILGGWSPQAVDCSGAVSLTVNHALGLPDFDSRMSTVTEGAWLDAKGALPGRGGAGDITIGWWDRGGGASGHTAMRLQDGTGIESGGGTGGGFTIGRGATIDGQGFTQWRHFDGDGTVNSDSSSSSVGAGTSLSASLSSPSISWGAAQDAFDFAAAFTGAKLYDQGGWLPHNGMAVNLSGKPEPVFTNAEFRELGVTAREFRLGAADAKSVTQEFVDKLPAATKAIEKAATAVGKEKTALEALAPSDGGRSIADPIRSVDDLYSDAASIIAMTSAAARENPARWGLQIGAQVMPELSGLRDAEQGLSDTRDAAKQAVEDIKTREEELAEARKELTESLKEEGGDLTAAEKKRLRTAEDQLANAEKTGDAKKIADAKANLAELQQDLDEKGAERTKKARENVKEAQKNLAESRSIAAGLASAVGTGKIALAIQAVKTAYDVIHRVAEVIGEAVNWITDKVNNVRGARVAVLEQSSALVLEIAQTAGEAREAWANLRLDLVNARLAERQAMWDMAQARSAYYANGLQGAVDVANARARLTEHEKAALKVLGTSVDDMWARTIAGLSEGTLTFAQTVESVQAHINEKLALEAEVHQSQAKALKEQATSALALLDSSREAAKAMLNATSAATLLSAQTAQLAAMQNAGAGMSTPQAMRLQRVTDLLAEAAMWDAKDKKEIKVEESRKYEGARDAARAEAERILAEHFKDDPQYQTYLNEIRDVLNRAGHWGFWNSPEDAKQVIAAALKTTALGKTVTALETAKVERAIAEQKTTEEKLKLTIAETALDASYAPEEARLRSEQAQWAQQESFHESAAAFYRTEDEGVKNALVDLMTFNRSEATKLEANTATEIEQLKSVAESAASIYASVSTDALPDVMVVPPSALPASWRGELAAALGQDPLASAEIHGISEAAWRGVNYSEIGTRNATKEEVLAAREKRDLALRDKIAAGIADARLAQTEAQLQRLAHTVENASGKQPSATIVFPPTEFVRTDEATTALGQGLEELGFRVTKLEGNNGANYFKTRMR